MAQHRREGDLGAITWTGAFSQNRLPGGGAAGTNAVKLRDLPASQVDRGNGGPVVVFDEDDG